MRVWLYGTNLEQTQPAANGGRVVVAVSGATKQVEPFGVAEKRTTPPAGPAVITGIVYTDADRDGTRDTGEAGRANVAVYVDVNRDGTRQSTEPTVFTNVEGRYRFDNATPGEQVIRVWLYGTNLEQTQPASNGGRVVLAASGATKQVEPFGVAEKRPAPTTAIVRGTVFYDRDGDGGRDADEIGQANVRVYLDLNNDGARQDGEPQRVTDSLGRYAFEAAPVRADLRIRLNLAGTNLYQTLPAANGARVVTTTGGGTVADQIFGVREVAGTAA